MISKKWEMRIQHSWCHAYQWSSKHCRVDAPHSDKVSAPRTRKRVRVTLKLNCYKLHMHTAETCEFPATHSCSCTRGINLLNLLWMDLMQQQRTKNVMKKRANIADAIRRGRGVRDAAVFGRRNIPANFDCFASSISDVVVCMRPCAVYTFEHALSMCNVLFCYLRNTRLVCLSTV